ncbi:hypothetical protein [Clostridium botulinum]|uniref:hypothetical protein n=1 Tax=Clostridium botulinum TaxID=1491 RepID=UPI0019676772|nr:hypothetical protein [Clostridium botulinum]MBN1060227.1 hypothetical protein [Clostridium botulinum]
MVENKIKVYIKIDKNNCITEINSSIFLNDIKDYICIDEGYGQNYAHAQNYYFEDKNPLRDNQGRCNYKYVDDTIIELSEEEKELLYPQKKEPTETEILQKQLLETQNMLLELQYKLTNKDLEIK